MINIQPISELRNYNGILDEVKKGEPVYLTKNGKGLYAIVDINDIDEYKKMKASVELLMELKKGEMSGFEKGLFSEDEVKKELKYGL